MRHVLKLIASSVLFGSCSLACGDGVTPATGTLSGSGGGLTMLGGFAGAAGNSTGGGAIAVGGAAACAAPRVTCAGSGCVDVTANDQHCGGCNLACTAGKHCAAGK